MQRKTWEREQARQLLHDVKIGDNVVAMLRTWASTAKRQSGETFWVNRTRIVNLQKEFQIGQTLPQTFASEKSDYLFTKSMKAKD